ncbi:TPA: ASCH domain-containing protein [Photobacterium damselae]
MEYESRPILFAADMVQALLSGKKTVTRRPLIIPPGWELKDHKLRKIDSPHPKKGKWGALICEPSINGEDFHDLITAPASPGDFLWVRETWGVVSHDYDENDNIIDWKPNRDALPIKDMMFGLGYYSGHVIYRADGNFTWSNDHGNEKTCWRPSIHMPRKASRITLKVTDVRIETMNDLRRNQEQIAKEGFDFYPRFKHAWSSFYGDCKPNDYVWVIEFEVIKQHIDTYLSSLTTPEPKLVAQMRHLCIDVETLLGMSDKDLLDSVNHPDGVQGARDELQEMLNSGVTCLVIDPSCNNRNKDGSCAGHAIDDNND